MAGGVKPQAESSTKVGGAHPIEVEDEIINCMVFLVKEMMNSLNA